MTEDLLKEVTRSWASIYEGWCVFDKAIELSEFIVERRPMCIVEIGIFSGKSLIPMAVAAKSIGAEVWGVDPWTVEACVEGSNDEATNQYWREMDKSGTLERIRKDFMRDMARNGVDRTIRVLMAHDLNVIQFFGDDTIGLLHLDSNHSPEVSLRSVQDWSKKVEHGGLFCMDDIDWAQQAKAVEWMKTNTEFKMLKEHDKWMVLEKL